MIDPRTSRTCKDKEHSQLGSHKVISCSQYSSPSMCHLIKAESKVKSRVLIAKRYIRKGDSVLAAQPFESLRPRPLLSLLYYISSSLTAPHNHSVDSQHRCQLQRAVF
jgi:hypothetical protein